MGIPYKRANNILLLLIVIINGYVILTPFAPRAVSWWQLYHTDTPAQLRSTIETRSKQPTVDQPNGLIIPSAALNRPIFNAPYSQRHQALERGIWHNPRTSTPEKGGNTVLAGHRFTYTQPRAVFYDLDRIKAGDEIAMVWQKKQYRYTVEQVKVVPVTDASIERPTERSQVTLHTSTPLFRPSERIVVIATPKEQS